MRLKDYEVLYAERAEAAYICRRPPDAGLYRVAEAADRERIARYIKYFSACGASEFCEDFCLNEKYYAVFRAPDGIPLGLSGETLTARGAMRALALQNPPPEIAVKLLSRERVYVCSGELEFACGLPEIDVRVTREYFFGRLADFLETLWEPRGDERAEKWLADLRGGRFDDLLSAYRSMPEPREKAENAPRAKTLPKILPKVAAAIAAAAAITALLAFARGGEAPEGGISSLGTIDLNN